MDSNLHPRNVFLTGASSGIGLETARLLSEHDFAVWGTSRSLERLPRLSNFHPIVMDLLNPDSIREAFSTAQKAAGRFDILINNSGSGQFGPVESQSDGLIKEQFQLMVYGPVELIKLALPSMRQRNHGLIVNVTSLASRFPIPYLGIYSSTKAALASLSETLRYELSHTMIRVVDIQPGDISTNFHGATARLKSELPDADQKRLHTVWDTISANMAVAPPPKLVAEKIFKVVTGLNPPPVTTSGGFFQAKMAPFLTRLAPKRGVEWFLRRYYKL